MYISVQQLYARCPQWPEEGTGSLRTEVSDRCEMPSRCWELSLGSLEEQPVLLTTESSFQSLIFNI